MVRLAVAQSGLALNYASAGLRADPAVVRLAVAQDGRALVHAPAGRTNPRAAHRT